MFHSFVFHNKNDKVLKADGTLLCLMQCVCSFKICTLVSVSKVFKVDVTHETSTVLIILTNLQQLRMARKWFMESSRLSSLEHYISNYMHFICKGSINHFVFALVKCWIHTKSTWINWCLGKISPSIIFKINKDTTCFPIASLHLLIMDWS